MSDTAAGQGQSMEGNCVRHQCVTAEGVWLIGSGHGGTSSTTTSLAPFTTTMQMTTTFNVTMTGVVNHLGCNTAITAD